MKFSKEELQAVVKWLENRHECLLNEKLTIECGDDFAHSNGKWPLVEKFGREASAIKISLNTAKDQLNETR